MVATQKTYVSCKNSDTYSVSRRFLPSRFWEFFLEGAPYINDIYIYIQNKWHVTKRLSKNNDTVVPALLCNKTEKVKNWIEMENLFVHVPGKNWVHRISSWMPLEKTVFQFFYFGCGTIPEYFLKNWKTESILWRISSWMSLKKSFSVFFRKYSGTKTEKLKDWKTQKKWIHMENLFLDLSGKNSL